MGYLSPFREDFSLKSKVILCFSLLFSVLFISESAFSAGNWQRTVVLIYGKTEHGQDMFFRGGIDSGWSNANRGTACTASDGGDHNIPCSIGIEHVNDVHAYTRPWRTGDRFLDWGKLTPSRDGRESEQTGTNSVGEVAVGTPAIWTTDNCASGNVYSESDLESSCNNSPNLYGGGYTEFNEYGEHYWILDVLMNCDDTPNGWFEFKSYISNGPAWEKYIHQTQFGGLTPPGYASGNHFASCGRVNVFRRNQDNPISINNAIDTDGDGIFDIDDADDDNDGIPDIEDPHPLTPSDIANTAPIAFNLAIIDINEGSLNLGDTLEGSYSYADAEGDAEGESSIRWIRNENTLIGTGIHYVITEEDLGQSIRFDVIPRAETGVREGVLRSSTAITITDNTPPAAVDLVINDVNGTPATTPFIGTQLVAQYRYVDAEFDQEDSSATRYQWFRDDVAIEDATSPTYTLVEADANAQIFFQVTPVAMSGITMGNPAVSPSVQPTLPAALNFQPVVDAALGEFITSTTEEVRGINSSVSIFPIGCEYQINDGSFTAAAGVVELGDRITLRVMSSLNAGVTVSASVDLGGVVSDFFVTTVAPETELPNSTIIFPVENSLTEESTILVRGNASDVSGIQELRVNGVLAETEDGYRNWQVEVPLDYGVNALMAIATDRQGNQSSQGVNITRGLLADNISVFDYDEVNRRFIAIAYERSNNTKLYSIDRDTGATSLISDSTTPNSDDQLLEPRAIVVNDAGTDAIVIDHADEIDVVRRVNLNTGVRSVITEDTVDMPPTSFISIKKMAFDRLGRRLFVTSSTRGVVEVDLATGARSLIFSVEDSVLNQAWGIAYDSSSNSLLVNDWQSLVSINLDSGVETIVSQDLQYGDNGLVVFEGNVYLARAIGPGSPALFSINVMSGELSVVSNNEIAVEESDVQFDFYGYDGSLAVDKENRRLFYHGGRNVISVNIDSGARNLVTPRLIDGSIDYDHESRSLFAVDNAQGVTRVSAINIDTGHTTFISDNTTSPENSTVDFVYPGSILVDPVSQKLYVGDPQSGYIVSVDSVSGGRTILTGNGVTSASDAFISPNSFVWDEGRGRIVVLDDQRRSVIAIDEASGERTLFSNIQTPNQEVGLLNPTHITYDSLRNQYLVLDNAREGVISIDANTGHRSASEINWNWYTLGRNEEFVFLPQSDSIVQSNSISGVLEFDGADSFSPISLERSVVGYDAPQLAGNEQSNSVFFSSTSSVSYGSPARKLFHYDLNTSTLEKVKQAPTQDSITVNTVEDIAIDATGNHVYILDRGNNSIYHWDRGAGRSDVLASNSHAVEQSNIALQSNTFIDMDAGNNRLIVSGSENGVILAVDMNSGARTLITSDDMRVEESDTPLQSVSALLVVQEHGVAYVINRYLSAVIAVDLDTGIRRIVSDNSMAVEESDILFSSMHGLAYDSNRDRILVTSSDSIIGVDVETGVRTLIRSRTAGDYSDNVTFFNDGERVLACSQRFPICSIFQIGVDGYSRVPEDEAEVLWNVQEKGSIIIDPSGEYALFANKSGENVYMKDLVTGESVVVFQ